MTHMTESLSSSKRLGRLLRRLGVLGVASVVGFCSTAVAQSAQADQADVVTDNSTAVSQQADRAVRIEAARQASYDKYLYNAHVYKKSTSSRSGGTSVSGLNTSGAGQSRAINSATTGTTGATLSNISLRGNVVTGGRGLTVRQAYVPGARYVRGNRYGNGNYNYNYNFNYNGRYYPAPNRYTTNYAPYIFHANWDSRYRRSLPRPAARKKYVKSHYVKVNGQYRYVPGKTVYETFYYIPVQPRFKYRGTHYSVDVRFK